MKTNIIPFAIIAIVGIFAVVIVSSIGVSQRADIQNAEENGGETEEVTEEEASDPEALFANSCASCHGGDLTGGAGPDLTTVGANLSAEEIEDVILNGQGTMPPGLLQGQEANEVAAWLAEMK
ncbi:MAG TPA: cytochrome c [Pseudogracilibacillus sp.]|nr:cytochrome c [Pseudogracilibacillus sp.]